MSPQALTAGREALAKVDEVIAKRPRKDDDLLSGATQALCTCRDGLIAEGFDSEPDRTRLEALNGVLAVVLGMNFPQAETPWDDLERGARLAGGTRRGRVTVEVEIA